MATKVVLEKEGLEEYYQKCLKEYSCKQDKREEKLKQLRKQLQELEQQIEKSQLKRPIHFQNSIRREQDQKAQDLEQHQIRYLEVRFDPP